MDRLWTPWRFDYISNLSHADTHCVFCRMLAENCDESNYILHRGKNLFLVLNLFPYTSGHILAVANRHITFLSEAGTEELHEFAELAQKCEAALRAEYHPEGFNLGLNLGRAAGAGVEHHLHMHVLPRWTGDSNFVSTVAETRIIPEDLSKTYRRLRPYFPEA
jgi:ATP adenylyltransferase